MEKCLCVCAIENWILDKCNKIVWKSDRNLQLFPPLQSMQMQKPWMHNANLSARKIIIYTKSEWVIHSSKTARNVTTSRRKKN